MVKYSIGFRLKKEDAKSYLLNLPDEKFIRKNYMDIIDND